MATLEEKQQIARENGRKSRGPVTPEGKAKCAQNPIKHGLASKRVVLANEDQSLYDQTLQDYRNRWLPADTNEDHLIVIMVNSYWRLSRLWSMETAFLDACMMSNSKDFEAAYPNHHPALRSMDALTVGAIKSPESIAVFDRYETRYDRQYHKAIDALLKLRRDRNAPPLHPNAAQAEPAAAQPQPEKPPPSPQPTSPANQIFQWIASILIYLASLISKSQPQPPKMPSRPTRPAPQSTPVAPPPLKSTFPATEIFDWWTDFIAPQKENPDAK